MKTKKLEELDFETVSHNKDILKRVLIRKGEISKLMQLAKVYFKPGDVADKHVHPDMFEVFYVESGDGEFRVNGEVVKVSQGSMVIVEPGDEHEVENTSEEEMLVTVFGVEV